MNLLGLRTLPGESNLTLDKLNKKIRNAAKHAKFQISIKQSHSESKIVSLIHKSRKKINHIILCPEVWCINGLVIKQAIELVNIPCSIILNNGNPGIFKSIINHNNIFVSDNYISGYIDCINSLKGQ